MFLQSLFATIFPYETVEECIMVKKVLIICMLFFATLGFSASEYDKDITVLNQSRNDKVVAVFNEMMKAYEEEDLSGFFSYVSEDRFIQDYMTFYDAVDKDMREYDILNLDTWIDKITQDGIKRYLYVKWDKRYQSTNSDKELYKTGYSRFLFDEVNGKYKLIGLAGNNFWGGSLKEWTEDVPTIPGQVSNPPADNGKDTYDDGGDGGEDDGSSGGLPDLTIVQNCLNNGTFVIRNIGEAGTTSGYVEYKIISNYDGSVGQDSTSVYKGDIPAGESSEELYCGDVSEMGGKIEVDPNNLIEESDEDNNAVTVPAAY